jgi:hypothetical protein
LAWIPSEEEINLVKSHEGIEDLDIPERYILMTSGISSFQTRIQSWAWMFCFDEEAQHLMLNMHNLSKALNEIRYSEKLRTIFSIILKLGNVMNEGTSKGNALGFRVESLQLLRHIKSSTSTINFLDYVVQIFENSLSYRRIDLVHELYHVQQASLGMSLSEIRSHSEVLFNTHQSITSIASHVSEEDPFFEQLDLFLSRCKSFSS